jgi:hypothetical protein
MKIIPLRPGTNIPSYDLLGSGWHYDSVGVRNPRKIIEYWQLDPAANVGVVNRGRFLILDLDNKPGMPRGVDSIMDLMDEYEPLPDVPWVRTPSGGIHLYFTLPEGEPPLPIANGYLRGVDLPGQVAAPPSVKLQMVRDHRFPKEATPIYTPYVWGRLDLWPPPLAPDWLVADIRVRPRATNGGRKPNGSVGHSSLPTDEWFIENGLGAYSNSRDDDALRWARRLWGRYGGLPDGEQIIYDMVTRAWERRTAKDHEFTLNDAYRKIEQARHYWDVEYQINLRMASSLFGDVDA